MITAPIQIAICSDVVHVHMPICVTLHYLLPLDPESESPQSKSGHLQFQPRIHMEIRFISIEDNDSP